MTSVVEVFIWPKLYSLGCLFTRRRLDRDGAVVDVVLARDELADFQ